MQSSRAACEYTARPREGCSEGGRGQAALVSSPEVPPGSCPAASWAGAGASAAVAAGTYQVVVGSWDCATDATIAEYQLTVDNASGISELEDELVLTESTREFSLSVAGSATLTP